MRGQGKLTGRALFCALLVALALPAAAIGFTESTATSNDNNFFGYGAGFSNPSGDYNSFLGTNAGFSNTTGASNSFFGDRAGATNTSGDSNSFLGDSAGFGNTTGAFNSFFGASAGVNNTYGYSNTFIGDEAGTSNVTGDRNTTLGTVADVTDGRSYATALGYRALVSQSNSLVLGAINGVNGASADTKVGIGTTAPAAALHIKRSGVGNAAVMRFEQQGSGPATAWDFTNNAATGRLTISDDPTGVRVPFKFGVGSANNLLRVGVANTNTVDVGGNLTVNGTFSNPSARSTKRDIEPAHPQALLAKLARLPIYTWAYRSDPSAQHIGPMAGAFHRAFGFGSDPRYITPGDVAGVSLAGVKSLERRYARQRATIKRQAAAIRTLQEQMRTILADRR